MAISITSLSQFLNLLGRLAAEVDREEYARHLTRLTGFLPEVGRFKQPLAFARKAESPDYNLFAIMKIRHYEAWVHTPFLVNLLDPKGSHAQGDLFYRLFVQEAFDQSDPIRNTILEGKVRKIKGEHGTKDLGIIDIWLEVRSKMIDYCLIIENKVYAPDQKEQLQRYYEYARGKGFTDDRIRILYLTPWHGGRPTHESMKLENQEKLISSRTLQFISYHQTIARFLHKSMEELKAPRLIHSIQQYLEVISTL